YCVRVPVLCSRPGSTEGSQTLRHPALYRPRKPDPTSTAPLARPTFPPATKGLARLARRLATARRRAPCLPHDARAAHASRYAYLWSTVGKLRARYSMPSPNHGGRPGLQCPANGPAPSHLSRGGSRLGCRAAAASKRQLRGQFGRAVPTEGDTTRPMEWLLRQLAMCEPICDAEPIQSR